MTEYKEIKCRITGKVQMVMFRGFVQRKARGLGIVGTVENMRDGSVRIMAQGSDEALDNFVEQLHKGSFLARVVKVEATRRTPQKRFTEFKILY